MPNEEITLRRVAHGQSHAGRLRGQDLAGAGIERGMSSFATKEGAMRTAFECFQKAAKCEEMASNTKDQANKTVLLVTAAHWRSLGNKSKAEETADLHDERRRPPKTI